jgi:hypothetical protein
VRPWSGRTDYEVLEEIVNGTTARPSSVIANYPMELEPIVMRLLERNLDRRYQHAEDVLADLERVIAKRGVFMSALVVAKYMRTMFADEIAAGERRPPWADPITEEPTTASRRRPRPDRQKTATWSRRAPTGDFILEEATEPFDRKIKGHVEPLRAPDKHNKPTMRVPLLKRAQSEVTDRDFTPPPFDHLIVFGSELLADLDHDAPAHETAEARTRRRVDTLVDRAFACYGADELDKAVTAVELAMSEDEGSVIAERLVLRHRSTLMAILEAFVGESTLVPRLARTHADFEDDPVYVRCKPLRSRIDGDSDIEELVLTTGLSPLETYRQLAALVLRGVVTLS